jgi:hypothetical protein
LTSITVEEIKSNIIDSIKEAKRIINSLRQDGRILWNSKQPSFDNIFRDKFNSSTMESHLLEQFNQFSHEADINIIDTNEVSPEDVFSKYFKQIAPFSRGKKKEEFPDAFTIAALEKWCEKNGERMYVVSGDQDMISACEISKYLISVNKTEALLELVTLDEDDVPDLAKKLLDQNLQSIEQQIKEQFPYLGFWVEDEEGDVEKVVVEDIKQTESYLVDFKDNVLFFDIVVNVTFSADVIYDDLSYAIYDREDDRYYGVEREDITIKDSAEINVEVQISFNHQRPDDSKVNEVIVDSSKDIGIFVRRYSDDY